MADAMAVLAAGPVTIAAGCTDLFPATQMRALPGPVLDITGVPDLRDIRDAGTELRIGAGVTWSDLVRADLPPAFDMLKQAAVEVGSVQIQNAATLVGNICNASPAADGVPCLLALDAVVEISSAAQTRRMALSDFIMGVRQIALRRGEMVTAICIPRPAMAGVSRFRKLGARRYLVISIAMVAMRLEISENRVTAAAIAVGACSPVATRLPALEAAITGRAADAGLAQQVSADIIDAALRPIDDIRATGPYRSHAAVHLLRRALCDLTGGST